MQFLPTLAFVIIAIAAMINLVFKDWRINIAALLFQYLAAFLLVTISWPISLAIIKLITGWMATATIGLTRMRYKNPAIKPETGSSLIFRGLTGLLVILLVFILAPGLKQHIFPEVDLLIIQGGLLLLSMSLLQLGVNSDPFLMIVSLLSFLTGFEIIHSALEVSTLLLLLIVIVNLGLALVGVYFILTTGEAQETLDEVKHK